MQTKNISADKPFGEHSQTTFESIVSILVIFNVDVFNWNSKVF